MEKEIHQNAFMKLKEAIIQAPTLQYPDTTKPYIVYMDASDDACRAQLTQIHDGTEFPVAFLLHTFTDTQRRWSTPKQEAYGIYFAIKKWNYYLQGVDIIVRNDHKPLARFLNGKNENTKINRWGLELASYNITFKWISGARNKAADYLSQLVELPQKHQKNQTRTKPMRINMVRAITTRSRLRQPEIDEETEKPQPKETNSNNDTTRNNSPDNSRDTSIQEMQSTDPFCIMKRLLNKTAPEHELKTFFIHNGLLYQYTLDHSKDFCDLVIPKVWKYMILVETHDKMGHQGNNCTYSLIKRQYYWKGMAKDVKSLHPTMSHMSSREGTSPVISTTHDGNTRQTLDKIAMDLVMDFMESRKGNKHILTIIDLLTSWPEAIPIPNKSADTITKAFIRHYLPRHMCPQFILSDNGTEFKNQIFDKVTKDLGIERIFSAPYHPQSNGKLETFHKFFKPTLKKMCADDQDNWDDYVEQVLGTYRGVPNLTTGESPFFLVYGRDGNQPVHQLLQPLAQFLGNPDSGLLCLDQHRLSLPIAKKYLDDHRFLTAEKTTDRAEPGFKVGDRVYFKNKTPGKWDLKWRAGYRIIQIECEGHYLHIENQATGKIRSCNVKDIVLEPVCELWNVNPEFGRASKFINHPDNLPDFTPDT